MEPITTRPLYRTRLFLYTLIVVILGASFAGIGVFVLLPSGLGEGYGAVIRTVQDVESILLQKVALLYAVIALGIVIAMIVLHLFYSHRIAGPVFRLAREAVKIGEGNLAGNIKFRQKDNLTDMADSLNNVALQYRARIEAVKNHLSLLEAQSTALSSLIGQKGNEPALEQAADQIIIQIKNIDRVLSEMRTC